MLKVLIAPELPAAAPADLEFILTPFAAGIPVRLRELIGLLPVGGINEASLGALHRLRGHSRVAIGLMLVDPFLRLRDVQFALKQAGVTRFANYPTIQMIDGETARALDSAGCGIKREIEMLAALRESGLEAIAFASSLNTAKAMLDAGASTIVLHPGLALSDWRERAAGGLTLVKLLSALRSYTDARLLVCRPYGFGHELDKAISLADGVAEASN